MVQVQKSASHDSLADELIVAKPTDLSHIQLPYRSVKSVYKSDHQRSEDDEKEYESDLDSDIDSDDSSLHHSQSQPAVTHRSFDESSSDLSDYDRMFEVDAQSNIHTNNQSNGLNSIDHHSSMPGDEPFVNLPIAYPVIKSDTDDTSGSILDIVDPNDPSTVPGDIAEKKPATWKVLTALVAAQLCWSGFHVIAKSIFNDGLIPPEVLPAFRTAGVVPVQAAWAYRKNPKFYVMPPRHHYIMLILAILGNTVSQQFFNFGESLSSATLAGSMQPLIPVLTTVFAIVLKREQFSWFKALGVAIAVTGSLVVVLLGSSSGNSSNGSNPVGGAMCFLVQTLCTSLYITIQKPLFSEGIDLETFNFYLFLYGGVGHIIIGSAFAHEVAWSMLPWTIIPVFFYVSIVSSFFAFMFFVFATKHLPASISSLAICLQSFFSPTLGAIFLGESLSGLGIFGGLLIVAGIVLVVFIKSKETKAEARLAQEKLIELESINTELEMLNSEMDQSISSTSSIESTLPVKSLPFPLRDIDEYSDSDSDSDLDDDSRFGYPQKSVQLDSDVSSDEGGI